MKKFITIALVGALVLGMAVTGVAFAKEDKGAKDKARLMPQMGTVVAKNANEITISAPGMDFVQITITLNDETKFYDGTTEHEKGETPPEVSISDIKKGDKIIAHGKIVREGEDSPTTYVAAKVIKVNQFPRPERPGGEKDREQPPTMNVLFKSANGNTITVTDPSGEKEFVITLAEEAKAFKLIKGEEGEKPTKEEVAISSLSAGDKLVITAKRIKDEEGNVIITARFILVVDEFPPPAGRDGDKGRDKVRQVLGTFNGFDGEYMILDPVADGAEQIRIKVSDKTKYVKFEKPAAEGEKPKRIEMEKGDLAKGQKISVQVVPLRDGEESRVAMAVVVVFLDEFPPGRAGGEITAINAKSVTVQMKNGNEATFEITDDTRFEIHKKGERDPIEAKKSDFKKGDMVGIMHQDGVALLITKRAE